MNKTIWMPAIGALCWVKSPGGQLCEGQIIGKRTTARHHCEWQVAYTAEATGFNGEKLAQKVQGYFPGNRLSQRTR